MSLIAQQVKSTKIYLILYLIPICIKTSIISEVSLKFHFHWLLPIRALPFRHEWDQDSISYFLFEHSPSATNRHQNNIVNTPLPHLHNRTIRAPPFRHDRYPNTVVDNPSPHLHDIPSPHTTPPSHITLSFYTCIYTTQPFHIFNSLLQIAIITFNIANLFTIINITCNPTITVMVNYE